MNEIFIVSGYEEYEASTPLIAFSSKEKAEHFVVECKRHLETHPECPDDEASDSAWDRFAKRKKAWKSGSPRKVPLNDGDFISVCPLELIK